MEVFENTCYECIQEKEYQMALSDMEMEMPTIEWVNVKCMFIKC